MSLWAKYDRANGRIVAIAEANQPPAQDKILAVIEVGSGAKVGDFIGDAEGAQEPQQDLPPDDPFSDPIGAPPPNPKTE